MRGGEGNLSPSKLSRQMQPLTFSTVGMNANRTFSSLLRLFFIPVPPRPPVQNAKILPGYIQVEVSFHQFSLFIFNFFNPRTLFSLQLYFLIILLFQYFGFFLGNICILADWASPHPPDLSTFALIFISSGFWEGFQSILFYIMNSSFWRMNMNSSF